jgi:hypothetical protein
VGLLDRFPVLKKAVFNQYQVILLTGAAAFAALTASGLPLLLLAGLELMTMPFLLERLKRRLEIEGKFAAREAHALSQEEMFAALPAPGQQRYRRLQQLCMRIQDNYRGLSPASQEMLADQTGKFDAILASCLRRLWIQQKLDEIAVAANPRALQNEIAGLKKDLENPALPQRVHDALQKNVEIKTELARQLESNETNREAIAAEVDSLESLLQLLLQKSVAATDAASFSGEIDDVVSQVQADAASDEEMERMLGSMPELQAPPRGVPTRPASVSLPPPAPPPARTRQR